MTAPNPLYLASSAQQLARSAPASDAAVFNKVALVCMGVMAAASVVQMLQPLLRELNKQHTKQMYGDDHGRGR